MGPLSGFTIIELAGIGPGPMGGMMLGDMGADVIRVDRATAAPDRMVKREHNVHGRSRRSVSVDLQKKEGQEIVRRLAAKADGLIDPFRPGVAERLNIGPDECLTLNPRLIYCRMTGWGQDGPLAKAAGHDINYIALTGLLSAIGRKGDKPALPLNLVGDYGGGGMLLAFGMVCGLLEAQRSGKGQVVDVAMTDGAALLFGSIAGLHAYDGHIHDADLAARKAQVEQFNTALTEFRQRLVQSGHPVPNTIASGTPTFALHARHKDRDCSPGTYVFWDFGYQRFTDLDFNLAALVLTRVISKPTPNRLCLDLGHKAIAAENPQPRVQFLNLPTATPVMHSEEHLVLETADAAKWNVGDVLYGVPRHICPTVALHDFCYPVENGLAGDPWPIEARRRKITI